MATLVRLFMLLCDFGIQIKAIEKPYSENKLFSIWIMTFAESLSFFLYSYQKNNLHRDTLLCINKKEEEEKHFKYSDLLLFFLCSVLDITGTYFSFQIYSANLLQSYSLIILIISLLCFSRLFLKLKICIHQALGISFFFIPFIINVLMSDPFINISLYKIFLPNIVMGLQIVIEKYIIETNFMCEYLLIGVEGIIGLIISTVLMIFINTETYNFENYDIRYNCVFFLKSFSNFFLIQ